MTFGKWSFLMKYIWPPSVIAGVLALLREWHRCDAKNKAILAVFFFPAMLCVGGLVFRIVYFILFNLPAFVLSILGWLMLISLFSGCGLFCHEKINGKRPAANNDSSSYDYDVTSDGETEKDKKNWFDDINIKWFKK